VRDVFAWIVIGVVVLGIIVYANPNFFENFKESVNIELADGIGNCEDKIKELIPKYLVLYDTSGIEIGAYYSEKVRVKNYWEDGSEVIFDYDVKECNLVKLSEIN
jgi:hypothetical protein